MAINKAGNHFFRIIIRLIKQVNKAYNLGTNKGYSVIEVVETARNVTNINIPIVYHHRRQGDPPKLVASSDLAKSELGWEPDYQELEAIIDSAWRWQMNHPNGYHNGNNKDRN